MRCAPLSTPFSTYSIDLGEIVQLAIKQSLQYLVLRAILTFLTRRRQRREIVLRAYGTCNARDRGRATNALRRSPMSMQITSSRRSQSPAQHREYAHLGPYTLEAYCLPCQGAWS